VTFLLTNDDGFDAAGLAALIAAIEPLGELVVVAPRDPQSYMGHRVTTDRELTLTEYSRNRFHVDGTPADCVRVALKGIHLQPDWVISGINHGGNLGCDVYSSGTVAAAREAALFGIPAMAISQYLRRDLMPIDWDASSKLASLIIEPLLAEPLALHTLLNINLPHTEGQTSLGTVHCEPDYQPLEVKFEQEGAKFRFSGHYASRPKTPGYDIDRCFAGFVTLSGLSV
jgi:5'-nucleotidase